MPTYIGFSTINANKPKTKTTVAGIDGGVGGILQPINLGKKFRLVDAPLILQDFVNSLNIRKGEMVGNPSYGTTIWDFIFEPNTLSVQQDLQAEIERVASLDPRLILNTVNAYPQENGILIEIEVAVKPFNQAQFVKVFFDNLTNQATLA